jgi:2,3-bisphosphoglycerate-dependent phosphoglycerate mutase
MKQIYFVRHAEPEHSWKDDRTRPLTETGLRDCDAVTRTLHDIRADLFVSSPYRRSHDTVKGCAEDHHLTVRADERFRERENGVVASTWELIRKRWDDFDFHEEGGESLRMVQRRNMAAVFELLDGGTPEEVIVVGTHGTALSTILNYFDPSFGFERFKRLVDSMPYIIRLDFDGLECVGKEELLVIKRPLREGLRKHAFM